MFHLKNYKLHNTLILSYLCNLSRIPPTPPSSAEALFQSVGGIRPLVFMAPLSLKDFGGHSPQKNRAGVKSESDSHPLCFFVPSLIVATAEMSFTRSHAHTCFILNIKNYFPRTYLTSLQAPIIQSCCLLYP
jgi:hypothetical protein